VSPIKSEPVYLKVSEAAYKKRQSAVGHDSESTG
jgi:hypothetical protein